MKSYNGWSASKNPADFGGLSKLTVATEGFAPGVRSGDVYVVLQYVAESLHRRVETVYKKGWHEQDDWGYYYRPNVNKPSELSCHSSGTAIDYNATRHPNGKRGTFSAAQVAEIRKILAEVNNVVKWGGDFSGTPDEMHFEICSSPEKVSLAAKKIQETKAPGSRSLKLDDPLMFGDDVWRYQEVVGRWYPSLNLKVDGWFGCQTDTATKELQSRAKLTVDGIVGPDTRKVLGL